MWGNSTVDYGTVVRLFYILYLANMQGIEGSVGLLLYFYVCRHAMKGAYLNRAVICLARAI